MVVLIGVAVVAAALAGPWSPPLAGPDAPELDAPPVNPTPLPTIEPDPLVEALNDLDVQPWDLTWLGVGLLTLIGVAALYLVLRWARNRPPRTVEEPPDPADVVPGPAVDAADEVEPDLDALRAGLDGAGAELRAPGRPADAVIAAWVALEEAAGRSGVARHPADTPTEFTVAVLDRTHAHRTATRTLLELYLRARFADERLTPDDVTAATTAVTVLAADLAGPDPTSRGDGPPAPGGTPRSDGPTGPDGTR